MPTIKDWLKLAGFEIKGEETDSTEKFSLTIPGHLIGRYRELQQVTGAGNDPVLVIRNALQLYEHIVFETAKGTRFYQERVGEAVEGVAFVKLPD